MAWTGQMFGIGAGGAGVGMRGAFKSVLAARFGHAH